MQTEGLISEEAKLRPIKYLNNIVEQDHRFSKRRIRYSQWLQNFETADSTISGYESMHMLRKGQVEAVGGNNIVSQKNIYRSNLWNSSINHQKMSGHRVI